MKIVQIIRNFSTGGAERFVIDLSNRLHEEGENVTIIRFFDDPSQNILESEVSKGVKIVTIRKKKGFDLFLIFRVFKYLKELKPNIVHTHLNSFNYCFLSFIFSKNTKYFHTIHSMPLKEAKNRIDYFFKKILFKSSIVNPISISNEVHNESVIHYGDNVKLIFNGRVSPLKTIKFIEVKEKIDRISENRKYPVIINIGNFKEAKNQQLLIKAINEVNKNQTKVKLIILGGIFEGDNYKNLKSIANNENIVFLGSVNNPTDYLLSGDYFCLSSLWEGMPISLIEAFATECIAISTPAGGIRSMITDKVNGFITCDFEKESLKDKILEALNIDAECKEKIIRNANNDYAQKYSIGICSDEHLKHYSSKLI